MCLDGTSKSCYNTNKEGNDRRSLPESYYEITATSLRHGAWGGYFFLLKEIIVNIITVKAVRNIPICVKSLSVMYTASPHFKAQRTLGDEFDRLTSKVSLESILAYYREKCNLSRLDTGLILCYIIDIKRGKRQTVAP